jgi:hypothetical protein
MVAMMYATGVISRVETMSCSLRQFSISAITRAGLRSVAMKVVTMQTKMPAALRGRGRKCESWAELGHQPAGDPTTVLIVEMNRLHTPKCLLPDHEGECHSHKVVGVAQGGDG